MSAPALKDARMELKTTKSMKEMLNTAASLSGQDLTSFVLASAEERARSVLAEYQTLTLLREEQAKFLNALVNHQPPTKALKELMESESLVER